MRWTQPCDLTAILRETIEDHGSLLEENGFHLVTELPDVPLWIMGDRTRLVQIVGNALHNATKFTDSGGSVAVSLAKAEQATAAAGLAWA